MHLIQILLPLADNAGNPFPASVLQDILTELSQRFGGLTAYSRAPAKGVWVLSQISKVAKRSPEHQISLLRQRIKLLRGT